jgi:transcriptional regulator with XRE-family HTH domain
MAEATTLGTWLRRERERRGVSLTEISDQTKLAVPLLEGLEADDLSRWPGGIFRRAFARSYAKAIGVDPDIVVRRMEEEHPTEEAPLPSHVVDPVTRKSSAAGGGNRAARPSAPRPLLGIAATLDLLVAGAIGLGFAAAGSRLLWPVLAIAAYHAIGVVLTGRSPMVAVLLDQMPDQDQQSSAPRIQNIGAITEDTQVALPRTDRTAASSTRIPTGRFRQPGRRGARPFRARA